MRFWDASAVLPSIVKEAGSNLGRGWLREDGDLVLWALSRLELVSAIERRTRERQLTARQRKQALLRIERISRGAHEVGDVAAIRARAVPLLARHPLRTAGAAQLGAALLVAHPEPASLTLVVLDQRLAAAAEREGLDVLTWPDAQVDG